MKTKQHGIEWLNNWKINGVEYQGETWNPITGCTRCSEGCLNCYAMRMTKRLSMNPQTPKYWMGEQVQCHPDELRTPYVWKKPRVIFICSMSDLFHEDVPFSFIFDIFRVIAENPQHFFIICTKREKRMAEFFSFAEFILKNKNVPPGFVHFESESISGKTYPWPLKNLMVMVTAENQDMATRRIPVLLSIPAAYRGVSIEPGLGPVDVSIFLPNPPGYVMLTQGGMEYKNRLDWIIIGGENGPGAREFKAEWALDVKNQCKAAGVPFFLKGFGSRKDFVMGAAYHELAGADDNHRLPEVKL